MFAQCLFLNHLLCSGTTPTARVRTAANKAGMNFALFSSASGFAISYFFLFSRIFFSSETLKHNIQFHPISISPGLSSLPSMSSFGSVPSSTTDASRKREFPKRERERVHWICKFCALPCLNMALCLNVWTFRSLLVYHGTSRISNICVRSSYVPIQLMCR